MAINRIRQLDGIEMLPNDKYRIRLSTYYKDTVNREEEPGREPRLVTLNPAVPAHAPAIAALRNAWTAVFDATGAER